MKRSFLLFVTTAVLCACQNNEKGLDQLHDLKKQFLTTIFESEVEEGPFDFDYNLRTIFFSKDMVSLFGKFNEYTNLPHGRARYEGKTFCKIGGRFQEVALDELFATAEQKGFLRSYCEQDLKRQVGTYLSGEDPICPELRQEDISTFVIDEQFLIVIFQPYVVGGYADGPFLVKIPHKIYEKHWNPANRLAPIFSRAVVSKSFISTWDLDEFFEKLLSDG